MGIRPISYQTFYTIFMQRDASFMGLWYLTRDFCFQLPLHSKVAMIYMVATMSFILAFPTMAGAMTGYSRNSVSFISEAPVDGLSTLIPFSRYVYKEFDYIVWDGSRIGKDEPYYGLEYGDGLKSCK